MQPQDPMISRRVVLRALSALPLAALPFDLSAQTGYPSRPVRLVVPFPPGGPADVLARMLAPKLAESLGQPVVIENRGGAGAAIGTRAVADAAPDGHTILLGTVSSHAINPILNPVIGYHPLNDFAAVGPVAATPFALVAHPSLKAVNVAELVALAKARPGVLAAGSAGNGTSNHLALELFKTLARVDIVHIPYKGSAPALADVLSGQVPLMFDLVTTSTAQIRAGALKALAVTSAERLANLPAVPTMIEAGVPGFDVTAWFGLFAPAATPVAVVARLNAELARVLLQPDVKERLATLGALALPAATPAQFAAFVRDENQRWAGVVKSSGMKID